MRYYADSCNPIACVGTNQACAKASAAFAQRALDPGAHDPAAVLAPVKERPGNAEPSCSASLPAVLDRRSAQRPKLRAGRDGKMIPAEPKDVAWVAFSKAAFRVWKKRC